MNDDKKPSFFKTLMFKAFAAMASTIVGLVLVIQILVKNIAKAEAALDMSMKTRAEWSEYKVNFHKEVTSAVEAGMSGVNSRLDTMNRELGTIKGRLPENKN